MNLARDAASSGRKRGTETAMSESETTATSWVSWHSRSSPSSRRTTSILGNELSLYPSARKMSVSQTWEANSSRVESPVTRLNWATCPGPLRRTTSPPDFNSRQLSLASTSRSDPWGECLTTATRWPSAFNSGMRASRRVVLPEPLLPTIHKVGTTTSLSLMLSRPGTSLAVSSR